MPTRVASDRVGSSTGSGLWLRSLHSLTGVVPIGVVFVLVLAAHTEALAGPAAHRAALARLQIGLAGQVVVLAALAFHAGFGLWLTLRARYSVGRYPSSANWMYTLQRASGVVALLFIGAHMALFWWPELGGSVRADDLPELMVRELSRTTAGVPLIAIGYLIGIGACAFHLAHGLGSVALRWGLVVRRGARRALGLVLAVVGLGTFFTGAVVVVYLATGVRLLGEPPPPSPAGACDWPAPTGTAGTSIGPRSTGGAP